MHNPTPAPIIVPATGAPTCRGVALTVRPLTHWRRDDDWQKWQRENCDMASVWADRATRDGHVLCLRPTDDRPACVGLSPTQFAVASLQDDFAARALVVDPYDRDGNDIREALPLSFQEPIGPTNGAGFYDDEDDFEDAAVAVWEGSEAT